MNTVRITADNFEQEVLKSDKKVVIDFWATWCGPCQMIGPVLEEIAAEHDEIKVCKVNVDEERALAMKFKVSSIPLLVVMSGGKIVNSIVGFRPKAELEAALGL